jgi:quercetin dioxygenase-like cupin family protein
MNGEVITKREGRDLILLLDQESLTVTWYRVAPGEVGPGPHVHHEHTDAFYVLEGEMTFPLGPDGEPVRAPAGTFVAGPPNLVHTFANESGAEARLASRARACRRPGCGSPSSTPSPPSRPTTVTSSATAGYWSFVPETGGTR